jgi:transketolase
VRADPGVGIPDLILLASGSEVQLALAAQERLSAEGVAVRVVSMASWELFRAQDAAYRETVLPSAVSARLAVEAGVGQGWREWVGDGGDVLCLERFGASAPGERVFAELGFTTDEVCRRARVLIEA